MPQPVDYDHFPNLMFGGDLPHQRSYDDSAAVILPCPFEKTVSYMPGTRFGPREILVASAQVELWDEEMGVDIHPRGMFTMPEVNLSSLTLQDAMDELKRVTSEIFQTGKFLVMIGGEHSITSPVVAAAAAQHRGLSLLQIDAHADLRASYQGEAHSHACAVRRSLEFAPAVQVGIRNISSEEVADLPSLQTQIFYDWNMRDDPQWMDRVVDALSDTVYITIDLDGLDPAMMPAVGTPEPGGLSWREMTALLRRVFERRRVVGTDVVELCPIPGLASPNFIAARLVYKILTYQLGMAR
jgi:agmatinase